MSYEFRVACELHSLDGLRAVFAAGLDARARIEGKGAVAWLTEMYTRSDRFAECLRLLLDHGAVADDPLAVPVLLNDPDAIVAAASQAPAYLQHRVTMASAFTPLAYAQLGGLPQMHRDERQIAGTVRLLLTAAGRPVPPLPNVPNQYLRASGGAAQ